MPPSLSRLPPRHVEPPAKVSKNDTLEIQIISVVGKELGFNPLQASGYATKPCDDVQSDAYFAKPADNIKREEIKLKPWDALYAFQVVGRDRSGRSCLVMVEGASHLAVAVAFPENLGDLEEHVMPYFQQMEEALRLAPGSLTTSAVQCYDRRRYTNNWTPDPADKTQAMRHPTTRITFPNMHTYRKGVKWMQDTPVDSPSGFPFKVDVWETKNYVLPEQRFILEKDLQPGGWIKVSNSRSMSWTLSTCDVERWCRPRDVTPVNDESIGALTVLSFDMEVKNGDQKKRQKMREAGLDGFPKAVDPTCQIIQISVVVRVADGRVLRFLLELDDLDERCGDKAVEQRIFEGDEYTVIYFQSEADMIVYFRDIVVCYDVDMLVSFNVS